jgi:hypothetical protein
MSVASLAIDHALATLARLGDNNARPVAEDEPGAYTRAVRRVLERLAHDAAEEVLASLALDAEAEREAPPECLD